MIAADHHWLLAIAIIVDGAAANSDRIWRRIPHPVALVGALIAALDRHMNRPGATRAARRTAGVAAITVVIAIAAGAGYGLEALFAALPYGWIGTVIAAAILLAGRSLYDHVARVAAVLEAGGLAAARTAVADIVGRDADMLDQGGVAGAAIESLAENFSDGFIAPALWFLVLGLPGIAAYKAINTADLMIGHLTERHADFGWASARLDDLVNLPASRIAGLLIALAAPSRRDRLRAVGAMRADAARHASPNAGWPEAAMAGALGLALGGPHTYGGVTVDGAWLNESGRRAVTAGDIRRALRVYIGAGAIFAAVVAVAGLPFAFA